MSVALRSSIRTTFTDAVSVTSTAASAAGDRKTVGHKRPSLLIFTYIKVNCISPE
jgi:hypothetical protein